MRLVTTTLAAKGSRRAGYRVAASVAVTASKVPVVTRTVQLVVPAVNVCYVPPPPALLLSVGRGARCERTLRKPRYQSSREAYS